MPIMYGTPDAWIDITQTCVNICMHNDTIIIPHGDDNRVRLFTDPNNGNPKKIYIISNDGVYYQCDENHEIVYNVSNDRISSTIYIPYHLLQIHSNTRIKYGAMNEEVPEQIMAINYLTGNEKVLEIGANVGRNSLVIAYLLKDNRQFVSLECNKENAAKLAENRDLNHYDFHVEPSALSKRKLIQKGWNTEPSEVLLDGYEWVNTITLEELNAKYRIPFDTLVLDCEGAFYYILMDMPEILDGIQLIIVENDYVVDAHKEYVNSIFESRGFRNEYTQSGGWRHDFYQVWKK